MKPQKQKRNLTPERLERLRASGRRPENIAAMQAGIEERRRIRDDAIAFQRDLFASVDATAHPGKRALVISAVASYRAIALLSLQIIATRCYDRTQLLAELLQPMQGELRRTLGLLGLTPKSDDAPHTTDTLESIALEYQKHEEEGAADGDENG